MKKIIIFMLLLSILCCSSCGSKTEQEPVVLDFTQEQSGDIDTGNLKLLFGELLSVKQSGGTVVVKAKIEENLTKDMTIGQNYSNVMKLVTDNGFNTCNELQYWAVMDLGMETKVISFTLDKTTIDGLYSEKIFDIDLDKYAKDLWIAPALQ